MPFQSEKQRRYLWANEPKIARDWADTYGSRIEKNDGGIMRVGMYPGGVPGGGDKGMKGKGDSFGDSYGPGRNVAGPVKGAIDEFKAPAHIQRELKALARNLAEDKREEKVESLRNKQGLFKNKRTRDFFLDKVLKAGKYKGLSFEDFTKEGFDQEEEYQNYLSARGLGQIDAYGNAIGGGSGGGGYMGYPSYAAWLAAQNQNRGTGVTEVAEVIEEDVPSKFQPVSMAQLPFPNYPFQAANGGRIPAAFGGIMDSSTGRRGYFLGSIGKAFGKVAKAAKKVFKSPIGKAALLGGLGAWGMKSGAFGTGSGWFGTEGKLAPFFRKKLADTAKDGIWGAPSWGKAAVLAAPLLAGTDLGKVPDDTEEGFDHDLLRDQYAQELLRIKKESMERSLNPNEWNYLGVPAAEGGRIGLYAGGQSIPSDYTIEDAMMTTTQDKLGGITDVMKQADLYRQGSVGQFYAAHGGRIGYDNGGSADITVRIKELQDEGLDYNSARAQAEKEAQGKAQGGRIGYADGSGEKAFSKEENLKRFEAAKRLAKEKGISLQEALDITLSDSYRLEPMAQGGRIRAQEGGLMDLGGMEKDYRNDGGFVPIGGEEKADDVPARLSKNEFVFTADAVRGAGGGDIDKGAEIMENIMKNLEQGGQISEETQGLTGAREMFETSQRLGEVV